MVIWLFDQKVRLYTASIEDPPSDDEEHDAANTPRVLEMHAEKILVSRVLYTILRPQEEEKADERLKEWSSDFSVASLTLPWETCANLYTCLSQVTRRLPPGARLGTGAMQGFMKLIVHSAPPPEKLTRETNFARWEARGKDYLQGLHAMAHSGAILALLADEVYDLALSADISAATAPSAVLDGLCKILGSFEHPWVLQADFHRRYQQPGESINDFQQALRLLGRRAFPTLDAKALSTRVLEQLIAGVRDPQIRKILLRDRPSTLEKALDLAREEEVLQAFVNNHRRRCSVSQLSSPTLPVTPPVSILGSLALVALLPGEETGVDPRPDDHKDPKPAAPSMPLTQAQNPLTILALDAR
ncbi:unnamed protein product [Schistocephalus solidus]|uniref:E3 ubiquitin-protein ligase E3D n=1 Tax=Schistocephalus solidus TaxID=70667 RepID=A0A183T905_SCHSO|nr:unnamed protein product [Schistocephalus solidus]